MIRFLIEKEFKLIFRDAFLPKIILIFPCIMMLVMPWAAELEIKNINLTVVDSDHSSYSNRLIHKIASSGQFHIHHVTASYGDALQTIEQNSADLILEIPPQLEQMLLKQGRGVVLISANSVNGTKGGLGSSYLSAIIADFGNELRAENPTKSLMGGVSNFQIVPQYRFNPNLNYKAYMVPALMVMLLTMLCGFLPALNIVSEKERGTIEQMNVTPIKRITFILGKLIPFWIIGLVVLTICFVIARFAYDLIPVGSFFTIYLFAVFFILVVSGFGLLISNSSDTMQQAMFVMFFFVLILILLSGLFTPIASMPRWAQGITVFNPLNYFMQVMRAVYLKGSDLFDLIPQLFALALFAIVFNGLAVFSYRKTN